MSNLRHEGQEGQRERGSGQSLRAANPFPPTGLPELSFVDEANNRGADTRSAASGDGIGFGYVGVRGS